MSTKTIITIERQYGSGGHLIGQKLAEDLDIPFYDGELIKVAAKESGICEEIFESFDEKPTTSFLYSLVMDPYSLGYNSNSFDLPLNHKVFLAAFDTIKDIASKGPCVFVGRCADYALEDFDNCLSVYIHAPFEDRIKRIEDVYEVPSDKSKEVLIKKDKQRSSYYNYYSSNKWGDAKSYDLCLDSSYLGIEGSVDLIKQVIKMKEAQ
ncbi:MULTISPECIES: cytidylate kinase-like family protein [Anaerostipes]|uniref:Cytidylate kinase n=1 Tax=Anaerostipes butyraticus TaxID=645466 RepID=A0A916Q6J2_9FIRM|nr:MULTISPECIES: cytidylate kinase-like family protein [Anaerostipes]GFO85172.1 cytidylate kinase [Anaerostipes butyraticus]HJC82317.1 cytidylate kinase-like family protein [Candidatus Anaerostipes avicola]